MSLVYALIRLGQAMKAIRESEQNFRDLIENLLDGVAIVDESAYHLYVNSSFAEITGYSVDELLNMTGWDFTRPEDIAKFKQRMKKRIADEPHKRMYERIIVRKDGTEVLTEMSMTTTVWQGKKRPLAIIRDITERKRTEEELREYRIRLEELVEARTAELDRRVAEVEGLNRAMTNLLNDLQAANRKLAETGQELQRANAELETFTYSVSHDLKAPLRGIDGYSRLLLEDHAGQLDDEGRTFLHTIRHAAEQMNQSINDLLAYSRLERRAMHTTSVNLRALVDALVAEYAEEMRERSVDLTVEVPCQVVMAEAEGLAQALRNLLDNALKFTRDVPQPRVEIGGRETENACIIWVRDNGIGFDMLYHDRIFEIFQRLHRAEEYPGTGVGLAIVRKAMQRMGGRAWAESAPGEGATFYLEIPR